MAVNPVKQGWTANFNGGSRFARIGTSAVVYLLLLGVLYVHIVAWPQEFAEGQVVPYTIFAPVGFDYLDSEKWEKLTGDAAEIDNSWVIDPQIHDDVLQNFERFERDFAVLRSKVSGAEMDDPDVRTKINSLAASSGIEPQVLKSLLMFTDDALEQMFNKAAQALGTHMSRWVSQETIDVLRQGGAQVILEHPSDIYVYFMLPNTTEYHAPAVSADYRERATTTILKDSVIVGEGQQVDRRIAEQLEILRPEFRTYNIKRFLGLALLIAALFMVLYFCLQLSCPNIIQSAGPISQLGGLALSFMLVGLLIGRIPQSYFYYGVSFAVSALATLVVLLYRPMIALYLGLTLGLLLSLALNFQSSMMLYTTAAALVPAIAINTDANIRRQVLFAFSLGLLNVLLALTVVLVSVQRVHWVVFAVAFLAGFLAAVLAQGMLPVMEYFTAQLTPGKLNDLANHENELLRKLKREAIGTYAHSVLVADLTEEACRAIDADWLKAKVGALYHDIGKLKRPGFFAENIHDLSKNPHDQLPPETSVKILKDHVSEGHVIAKAVGLPRDLHAFILEHHGTYLIKYFYYRALDLHKENPEDHAEPEFEQFCYGGPVPRSKESGVVMLADITEAVTRSRPTATGDEIVGIVSGIITEKIEEGQLVDSGLTIGDLDLIRHAFVRVLAAQRHQRVTYPDKAAAPLQFYYLQRDENGK